MTLLIISCYHNYMKSEKRTIRMFQTTQNNIMYSCSYIIILHGCQQLHGFSFYNSLQREWCIYLGPYNMNISVYVTVGSSRFCQMCYVITHMGLVQVANYTLSYPSKLVRHNMPKAGSQSCVHPSSSRNINTVHANIYKTTCDSNSQSLI